MQNYAQINYFLVRPFPPLQNKVTHYILIIPVWLTTIKKIQIWTSDGPFLQFVFHQRAI